MCWELSLSRGLVWQEVAADVETPAPCIDVEALRDLIPTQTTAESPGSVTQRLQVSKANLAQSPDLEYSDSNPVAPDYVGTPTSLEDGAATLFVF